MARRASGYLGRILITGEDVLLVVRQHPLFLWGRLIGAILFAIIVVAVVWALQVYVFDRPEIAYGYVLALLALPTAWWRWLVWSNRQYVVTNRRVMSLSGVFTKEVIDSLLEKVNDLKTDQTLLGRVFGYGDIEILTASEAGINAIRHISRPLEFKRLILDAKERLEHGH
jgi:uncharacterized membrane protein YdbT with pleckstrin-like domain